MKTQGITISEIDRDESFTYRVGMGEEKTVVFIISSAGAVHADITVELAGEGARADILGFIVASGKAAITVTTHQRHRKPGGKSNLLIKGIESQAADVTFNGAIEVNPGAQLTDAYQRNEHLVLSDGAHVHTSPALEILANDVRCTHGATISRVSDEELWYLATRGIGEDRGKRMIAEGFLTAPLERIPDDAVREDVRSRLKEAMESRAILDSTL